MSAKCNAINVIKGISICGVVFHHLVNRRFDPETQETIRQVARLFSWCVFAFIAASGWLHANSALKAAKPIQSFVRTRAYRLLIPYVVLTLLYACVWQAIQMVLRLPMGDRLPESFGAKLTQSLFQTGNSVGEQLYFLPVLFALSIATEVVWKWCGGVGVAGVGVVGLGVGLVFFANDGNTGMSGGVLAFGALCYAGGFLTRVTSESRYHWAAVGGLSVVLLVVLGWNGVPKVVPLVFMAGLSALDRFQWPALLSTGEASGTIFAYHTPFILQPLVLACTRIDGWYQMVVLYAVALSVVGALTWAHGRLKGTRLKFLLL